MMIDEVGGGSLHEGEIKSDDYVCRIETTKKSGKLRGVVRGRCLNAGSWAWRLRAARAPAGAACMHRARTRRSAARREQTK